MKKITFIILLLISLASSAQNRRVEYRDIDLFLIPKEELISYVEKVDYNYDTTKNSNLCVDINYKYSVSIVYDEGENPKIVVIKNPPYYTMSVWNLCMIDSFGRLCYLYENYTYIIQFNNNELVLKMI